MILLKDSQSHVITGPQTVPGLPSSNWHANQLATGLSPEAFLVHVELVISPVNLDDHRAQVAPEMGCAYLGAAEDADSPTAASVCPNRTFQLLHGCRNPSQPANN